MGFFLCGLTTAWRHLAICILLVHLHPSNNSPRNSICLGNIFFFIYLHVRSFIRNLDSFLISFPTIKAAISCLYNLIYSLQLTLQHKIKTQREEDLGEEISEELWDAILHRVGLHWVHSSSICARHGLTQCKILHHTHLTWVRLSKIYNDVDPMCIRCHQAPATHVHMFWSFGHYLIFERRYLTLYLFVQGFNLIQ